MKITNPHPFHIPVMGIAFTVDTPIKVAQYGISSVVSVVEDELLEKLRAKISADYHLPYEKIEPTEFDYKAKRITAYLNTLLEVVNLQMEHIRKQDFESGVEINRYFHQLPNDSELKKRYESLKNVSDDQKLQLETLLREQLVTGSIDVNIMTKVDRVNFDKNGDVMPPEFSDAMLCLRGFAQSNLNSSVVFSAGLNPRLYSYCEQFSDFFPDENGTLKKKIILKVSDYRSALIQGKFFAKKGIWISEFRIESGINCGGHAFIANGVLLGPILEEFKNRREELYRELYAECNQALSSANKTTFTTEPVQLISAQGGFGTAEESKTLSEHFDLDSIGWGSPFLLVPEVTNVDKDTLNKLARAVPEDYYLSNASPLGVPFNNFRNSSAEEQRLIRIQKNRSGSPCFKKHLAFNKEFTEIPICSASRQYQKLKTDELNASDLPESVKEQKREELMEKDCLCEGLSVSALLKNNLEPDHKLTAVTICPGPNLQYFSGIFTLKQMIDHIYGRTNILNTSNRPHMFINELQLYVDYIKKDIQNSLHEWTSKKQTYLNTFQQNLLNGIEYYEAFFKKIKSSADKSYTQNLKQLNQIRESILHFEMVTI